MVKHFSDCCGCFACSDICPVKCIEMRQDSEGFFIPVIQKENCIGCEACSRVCPLESNSRITANPRSAAAYTVKEPVRKSSSSGGIFYELASYVISQKKGVVYGACFSEDLSFVSHVKIDSLRGLDRLQGSKYVQSRMAGVYAEIRKLLSEGTTVLFSGTPCQAAALRRYIGEERENLILVDLVCHGVPSEKVWNRYLSGRKHNGRRADGGCFRDKQSGWNNFLMSLRYPDGSRYRMPFNEDAFGKAFLANICLRKSCYKCKFKTTGRVSDFTLGDFWGIESMTVSEDFKDDKGVSLVLLHSEKAESIWRACVSAGAVKSAAVPLHEAVMRNPYLIKPAEKSRYRKLFFDQLDKISFDQNVKRHAHQVTSLKGHIGAILKKAGIFDSVYRMVYKIRVKRKQKLKGWL